MGRMWGIFLVLALAVGLCFWVIDMVRSRKVTRAVQRSDETLEALFAGRNRVTYRLTRTSMPFDVVATTAAVHGWSVDGMEGDAVVLVRDAD